MMIKFNLILIISITLITIINIMIYLFISKLKAHNLKLIHH